MLRSLCRACLRRVGSRGYATRRSEDDAIRTAFDRPARLATGVKPTGLFDNAQLDSPDALREYARRGLRRAETLARHVSERRGELSAGAIVTCLDRLSDTLCAVLDMAEFVRNAHPDARYVQAAEDAYETLHGFMSTLNTHQGLYEALRGIDEPLGDEERAVVQVLMADFLKSGIQLSDDRRREYVRLSGLLAQAERRVFTDFGPAEPFCAMPKSAAHDVYPSLVGGGMRQTLTKLQIPTSGWEAHFALQRLAVPESRRALERAMHSHRREQLDSMDAMLTVRGQLARLVGRPSFADTVLPNLMARSQSAVNAFLENLRRRSRPLVDADLDDLRVGNIGRELHSWDVEYLTATMLRRREASVPQLKSLAAYLSVGTVVQGLSRLLKSLFQVELVPREVAPGEVWHSDVRRLDVVHADRGHIGVLYADLFSRPGKAGGQAAHFTIRCGRRIDRDDGVDGAEDLCGSARGHWDGKTFQLPIIALQCDFASSGGLASLTLGEVGTLFHEMGHAIHTFLGTTDYHIVSGTRVAADFVELPSQLMESFVASSQVWPLFARHHVTDEVAPAAVIERWQWNDKQFGGLQLHRQWLRAQLDQDLHSGTEAVDSHAILQRREATDGLVKRDDALPWHVGFTHLAGYAATYYAYLFDKAIADQIWRTVFANDPLSLESGKKLERALLRHGGARDPWHCVADVLDDPSLAEGGDGAMAKVGTWHDLSAAA